MFSFVFLVAVFGFAASDTVKDLPVLGIVGGKKTDETFFKFQISLEYSERFFCGGTLVKRNIVVTAAHCLTNKSANKLRVRTLSNRANVGGETIQIKEIVSHPSYNNYTQGFDVAVIKLVQNANVEEGIGTMDLTEAEPEANSVAFVSGWGHTKEKGRISEYLQFTHITIFDREYCVKRAWISEDQICGGQSYGGVDSCNGDSGGPLFRSGKLVGIVSGGLGCGHPEHPGIYSNVAFLKPWIDKQMAELLK